MTTRPSTPGSAAYRRPSQDQLRRFSPLKFFQEVLSELRKAVWPSREETIRLTWVVIVIAAFVGSILGALDFTYTRTFTRYIVLP